MVHAAFLPTRRTLLTGCLLPAAAPLGRAQGGSEYVVVETAHGRLRGFRRNGVVLFRGVPYAGPVAGSNRFRKAPPLEPWTKVSA